MLEVWERWESHPGDTDSANRMENECQLLASQLGMSATQMREWMMSQRRSERSIYEIIGSLTRMIM